VGKPRVGSWIRKTRLKVVRERVGRMVGLTAPRLESWLMLLMLVENRSVTFGWVGGVIVSSLRDRGVDVV
jgi:hypothetical protein